MGASTSKQQMEVVCVDCDKKTQKDLPQDDSTAAKGMPCEETYLRVIKCMEEKKGQVSLCQDEWTEFRICRAENPK
ncbi:hypothetical protein ACHAXS_002765 [Conticribra weissflogii]